MSNANQPPEKSDFGSSARTEAAWIEYTVQQIQRLAHLAQEKAESVVNATSSRLSDVLLTSSAHFHMTSDSLKNMRSGYEAYEDYFFGKVKDGVLIAYSHSTITCGVAACFGMVACRRPRRFLFYSMQRLLAGEEYLLNRAHTKMKELQESINLMKSEFSRLEESARTAEQDMQHGREKLRNAGNQIYYAVKSATKIESKARGLKDIIGELSGRDASRFRDQVSSLTRDLKQEKNALRRELSKITNYGISI